MFVPLVCRQNEQAWIDPGGHSPEKVVWACPAVKTPFSRLFRRILDPQLQHDSVL